MRQEAFGLLFYDTRSTRITFVRSGDRLVPPPFVGECRVLTLSEPNGVATASEAPAADPALFRVLADLVEKGLLLAPPAE